MLPFSNGFYSSNTCGKRCNDDIFYVATTQEELRGRGAQTAAFAINPDICIVLDVTHATDYPGMSPIRDGDINLGKGVVVAIGPNMDNEITKKLYLWQRI